MYVLYDDTRSFIHEMNDDRIMSRTCLRQRSVIITNRRFGTFGDLAARVRNYTSRGRESVNYGGAILLGLTALEWEEGAQHPAHWRFVTLYTIVSQTVLAYVPVPV